MAERPVADGPPQPDARPAAASWIAGRYDVVRRLGAGSFGQTLLARDHQADRMVAIKVLRRPEDLKAYELFEREARVLRSLRHRAIPEVHEQLRVEWQGAVASLLVMEYIDGRSLASVIDEGPHFDRETLLHVFVELLGVLDYLHGRVPPVLHRDIKPGNVLLREDGSPALVDFGAVRSVFHGPGEDGSTVVGTYGYMPYEQYMGQASPASDLFSLAATFLHLVTGRPPRDFMTAEGRLAVPESLPCGEPLGGVLTRLLQPNPGDRFQSAREARGALFGAVPVPSAAGGALVAGGSGRPVSVAAAQWVANLPPGPREWRGQLSRVAWKIGGSPTRLTNAADEPPGALQRAYRLAVIIVFGVVSFGIVPALLGTEAWTRRRRLKPFFVDGHPAVGTIVDLTPEQSTAGVKYVRVRYEFAAAGSVHRGSDRVLAWNAARWYAGDRVPVLYLPDRDFDSVLVPNV